MAEARCRSGSNGESIRQDEVSNKGCQKERQNGMNYSATASVGKGTKNYKNGDSASMTELDSSSSSLLDTYLIHIVAFRLVCAVLWTAAILYASYHVYLAAEDHIPWMDDPIMNPGPLSDLLNRGWDNSDYEWTLLAPLVWTKLLIYYVIYAVVSRMCVEAEAYELSTWISPGCSFLLHWQLVGFVPSMYLLFATPLIYWLLLRLRSKALIWAVTTVFVILLTSPFNAIIVQESYGELPFLFGVFAAWNYSRSVSFCFDVWDRPEEEKFSSKYLGYFVKYIGYMPLTVSGPLVMYHHFESKILQKELTKMDPVQTKLNLNIMLKGLLKALSITGLIIFLQHFLYYRPLSLTIPAINDMNLWALCGTIYWLGQGFALKYKVLYGVPSFLAEFDGLDMYPLPCCPAYVHRYSALWKDFDRGLYVFLVRYIYVPMIKWLEQVDPNHTLKVHKLIASGGTFIYIYIWHTVSYEVFIWTLFNFIGVTVERIGSALKVKYESITVLDPIIWDFIVEPLVTVPLAAMSILNSSIFCGNLRSATAFSIRLWNDRADNYVLYFLYLFTHVGVTARTWNWTKISQRLKMKLKQL